MTKQERKLKSMLNYFQIDLKSVTDEKISIKEKNKFIDRFNQIYDSLILQDIVEKIKQKTKDEKSSPFDNDNDNEDEDFSEDWSEEDSYDSFDEKKTQNENDKNLSDPISTDINKFLKWLTLVLYTGNHSVIISEDTSGIYIKLIKIKKDKGKK